MSKRKSVERHPYSALPPGNNNIIESEGAGERCEYEADSDFKWRIVERN